MENILSSRGLSSSEANHITNIVKELTKDLSVGNFPLTTSSVRDERGDYLPLDENKKVENWVENTKKVGELFSLSAWLKSAIKFKESKLNIIDNEYFVNTLEVPKLIEKPQIPDTDFEDYLNQLNTKQRNEYLSNEAVASHIGKFIHNFDRIREESENFRPTTFIKLNDGTSRTVVSYRLYEKQELLDGFFELQKSHREAEKVVNLYKSRHKEWQREVLEDHASKVKSIESMNVEARIKHNRVYEEERLKFESQKRDKKKEISALKIVVPSELQDILDYVNTFAKR